MFCGLREERTRFRKKKRGKKENLLAAKSGLVGMKEHLKTYQCEIFFAVLLPFLNETAFYAKLLGRFLGPKTKVSSLIVSKFGTNIQLINLKLLSLFHVARSNRSRVISKSLKFRTH